MRLYLAGPMSGLPHLNHPAFHEAAARLRAAGFEVWSPAEYDVECGIDPDAGKLTPELYAQVLAADLQQVCAADGVALLPDWHLSKGARAECATADAIGTPAEPVVAWLEGATTLEFTIEEAA